MVKIDTTYNNNLATVVLEGKATIQDAPYIQQKFLEVLKEDVNILLDMKKLNKVDFSFLQIVESLCLTLKKKERTLIFESHSDSEALYETIKLLGFFKKEKCIEKPEERCHLQTLSRREKEV